MTNHRGHEEISMSSLSQSIRSGVRAADMIFEGRGSNYGRVVNFLWFCHLCQISGITSVVLRTLQEMAAPSTCARPLYSWNLQLGKSNVQQCVVLSADA